VAAKALLGERPEEVEKRSTYDKALVRIVQWSVLNDRHIGLEDQLKISGLEDQLKRSKQSPQNSLLISGVLAIAEGRHHLGLSPLNFDHDGIIRELRSTYRRTASAFLRSSEQGAASPMTPAQDLRRMEDLDAIWCAYAETRLIESDGSESRPTASLLDYHDWARAAGREHGLRLTEVRNLPGFENWLNEQTDIREAHQSLQDGQLLDILADQLPQDRKRSRTPFGLD
jgi:hypothetical protein